MARRADKEGLKEYRKAWAAKNKDRINKNAAKFRENNRDKLKERANAHYEKYKDKINERSRKRYKELKDNNPEGYNEFREYRRKYYSKDYNREYVNKRTQEDIQFRIARRLRTRLYQAIKGKSKRGSAITRLGCSLEFFIEEYFPKLFQEGMSWSNYGEWHIDHIKPLASFDLTDDKQITIACHYSNLQPLWALDNIAKRDKVVTHEN